MELSDILLPSSVFSGQRVQSKKRLFQEIAAGAASELKLNESEVLSALLERESLGPTGVGHGVAIPHARIPGMDAVRGVFLQLEAPVEYGSVDHRPVDLVFALFAPKDAGADHLKALARVSRTLRSEALCSKLRSNGDVSVIYDILSQTGASQAA